MIFFLGFIFILVLSTILLLFCRKYNSRYASLSPSSRASISTLLDYLKFDRSKIVNIPKWSSHCLFETIGSKTNISVNNLKADLSLIIHKWGITKKNSVKNKITIEDSVDSLPVDNNFKPFINNGIIEIISLPKIIGSYSGGIVLTNNKSLHEYYKEKQTQNLDLGYIQSKKKYKFIFNFKENKFTGWPYDECFNTSFDSNVVDNIDCCLEFFYDNIKIILQRRKIIKELYPKSILDYTRLGPCSIFRKKDYKNFSNILNKKHFNYAKRLNNFEEVFILPIHFGINDNIFFKFIKKLNKKNK